MTSYEFLPRVRPVTLLSPSREGQEVFELTFSLLLSG